MAYGATNRASRETHLKGGKVIAFEVLAAKTIYKGDIVRIPAAGYALAGDGAASLAQYDCCAGIALETVDNTAGGKWVRVLTEGIVNLTLTSSATAIGTRAIQAAGNAYTVTSAATALCAVNGSDDANNEVHVGMIVGIPENDIVVGGAASTTHMLVKLQTLRQAYQ
jgi:hypothetical protein